MIVGCVPSPHEQQPIHSAVFAIGGGEPGAGSVSVEILNSGQLNYRRIPDYAGDWNVRPVERTLTLDRSQASPILRRIGRLPIENLKSEEIPCCDLTVSELTTRTAYRELHIQRPGEPCEQTQPKAWREAWYEICELLKLAEPSYWKERDCFCVRDGGA